MVPFMRRHLVRLSGSALLACVLSACASSTVAPVPAEPEGPSSGSERALPRIDGIEWVCVELLDGDGRPVAPTDRPPTLLIGADGRASGFAGVNRFFAEASIGNTITAVTPLRIGPVGATRMAGPPERMALEQAYTAMLESARSAVVTAGTRGPTLTLRDERGDRAKFEPASAASESR